MKTNNLLDLILSEGTLELLLVKNSGIERKNYYLIANQHSIEQLKKKLRTESYKKEQLH